MPTYDTTSPEYIQAKQERLEELGRRCTLISTEGTQQYQRSLIMCNGCGGTITIYQEICCSAEEKERLILVVMLVIRTRFS